MNLRLVVLRIFSTTPILLLGFLPFMNHSFAWQYNLDGTPVRFGSRYELILYILIPIIIGWGCYYWINNGKGKGYNIQKNEKFVTILAITIVILFQGSMIWSIISGLNTDGSSISTVTKMILYLVGILLLAYGNQLPRASFKSEFGFKNMWTTDSEKAWIYSQKWVGILCMLCGMSIILLNVFLPLSNLAVILLLPIGVFVLGSYLLSYMAYIKTSRTV
ncbi:SdpI family protein [Enterococcus sp. BWM-S5]|uniref:SdpI family protein n=1 Tax=Enterococcus larvae TaxID=2794352 RepID=A0ABS4CH66_9ENTE|nr:SdpI family protein [Enterococcus larvae]MBP1045755.1 SdpI family protein [Enterococcus larvae]